jgi:23S rRNA (adenine1618-N6)-methyltransferase
MPALQTHIQNNIHGEPTVDFAKPEVVLLLNQALLLRYYNLQYWEIPPGYLCPPVPGRADYIHHVSDLLGSANYGKMPIGPKINCLDIGTGANLIYPIVGVKAYGWSFTATETDITAFNNARNIVTENASLTNKVVCRHQPNPENIFHGAINPEETFDLVVCNPPFHASQEDALSGSSRKIFNLKGRKTVKPILNFGGKSTELICPGGEKGFISRMIIESKSYANTCFWFTSLVSRKSNLKALEAVLRTMKPTSVKTISMGQGNKSSSILAWTFLTKEQQKIWSTTRFGK